MLRFLILTWWFEKGDTDSQIIILCLPFVWSLFTTNFHIFLCVYFGLCYTGTKHKAIAS